MRHVSHQGCQFQLDVTQLAVGKKLAFLIPGRCSEALQSHAEIRWIVDDRIGVQFNPTLSPEAEEAIQLCARQGKLIDLDSL